MPAIPTLSPYTSVPAVARATPAKGVPTIAALAAAAAFSAALAVGTVALPAQSIAAVITIQPPTPVSASAINPANPAGPDTRIGAGVPNTGGVAPDTAAPAAPAIDATASAVAPSTNAELAANALATTNAELVAIATIGPTSSVLVVMIGSADPKGDLLTKARTAQAPDIDRLQKAIGANAMLKADLAAKQVDIAKIVAAEVDHSGALTLYATG